MPGCLKKARGFTPGITQFHLGMIRGECSSQGPAVDELVPNGAASD